MMKTTDKPQIQMVPIESLYFDPENPRLPTSVNGADDQAVFNWMLKDATIIELMGAIGTKGYFPGEPLLVVRHQKKADSYIVVEGNRRLTATKLLLHPELAPRQRKAVESASQEAIEKPLSLPVVVYGNRQLILDYLGFRHFTGVKSWGSLAKAKYLSQLIATLPEDMPQIEKFRELAKSIGSRADYVAKTLTGFRIYTHILDKNFYDITTVNEDAVDFAVLTTALSYGNISTFVGLKSANDAEMAGLKDDRLKELTSWLFEKNDQGRTRLGESRRLAQLNNVVGNDRAIKVFRDGASLQDADLLTEAPNELFRKTITESRMRLSTARDHFHLVTEVTSSEADVLMDIFKMARNLKTLVDEKLLDSEDDI